MHIFNETQHVNQTFSSFFKTNPAPFSTAAEDYNAAQALGAFNTVKDCEALRSYSNRGHTITQESDRQRKSASAVSGGGA